MLRWAYGTIEDGYIALKDHEVEIERLKRLYAALSHISQAIGWTRTRDDLLRKICEVLTEHGGFQMAWIGWHQPEKATLAPAAASGQPQGYLQSLRIFAEDGPEDPSPTGNAFREGRESICNDLHEGPSSLPWRQESRRRGFHSAAAFPIKVKGEVQGTLNVYAGSRDFFQEKEVGLLAEAATDISFALENLSRDEERRQAEQEAERERSFSSMMIESLPGILYFYDENGKFLRWNHNFETVTGYTGAEIGKMKPRDFFPVEDRHPMEVRISEVMETGESSAEAYLLAKDGTRTPYYFTGRRVDFDGLRCLVGVGIDITERVRADAARRESEARYRTLFQHAPDGILIADSTSRYIDANASMCRMLGYSKAELAGLHAKDIIYQIDQSQIEAALSEIHTQSEHQREWVFLRKDGTTFPAEVLATAMPDGNLMGMVRDITERHVAGKKLKELYEGLELKVAERTAELQTALVRAEAADRLKSAFLATMSHELRTPLNSIIGFTGVVLQGLAGPLNAEQTKQLTMVRGSARHLLELINDVLDLSKIEAGQLEVRADPFNLKESVERVCASVQPLADKKRLTLTGVFAPELGEMVGDRRRVEQVLLNLLNNAIKFTEHGAVTFEAESLPHSESPRVRLTVRDTGMGILPADLATLFQPFRQIDTGLSRQHEGTGLGLAICRRLVTLMGGTITAASEPSRGSEFTVILPLQPVQP
jgi:PAS domain S-box-containing protein